MILAGDIGGTNTRLAWCEVSEARIDIELVQVFPSRAYESLRDIVQEFVSRHDRVIEAACFGVAGPVRAGRSRISNLTWEVDGELLAELLGLSEVVVANDLEVNAHGLGALEEKDFAVLSPGEPDPEGNQALIAAGTGLGQAGLHFEGGRHHPFPSEGGHVDFAPRDELEDALLVYLRRDYGRVSYERVLSGPGLYNIYRFLRDTGRAEEPPALREEMQGADPAPLIGRHALSGTYEICVETIDRFVSIYGAEAGNLSLKLMATAGLFVGGGIAPKILLKLEERRFMEGFVRKGRMTPLLERIPVRVVRNDYCALLGSARLAHIHLLRAQRGRTIQ